MSANSTPVYSNQPGINDQLARQVARHAASTFQKPIAGYNQIAFDQFLQAWEQAGRMPLIVDAGCGIGLSTFNLAVQFPDHFVLGVDQSADRISRNVLWPGDLPPNCLRLRADMVDIWRLLLAAGIRPARQYVLYPNPWPKKTQLARRWHGHPVFPAMVALGGLFECRSNWKIYIEECAAALEQLLGVPVATQAFFPQLPETATAPGSKEPTGPVPITPFEHKYLASGHGLWRCQVDLSVRAG
jgi:tRNA G46 methylase TrmB